MINLFFFFYLYTIISVFLIIFQDKVSYKWLYLAFIFNSLCICSLFFYYYSNFLIQNETIVCNIILTKNLHTNINLVLSLKINFLSYIFSFLIIMIGFATNIYALSYLKFEENTKEFVVLLNCFIISMLILCLSNNLFTLILGWELIGLTSFLLINFWKLRNSTFLFSFKAFSFNKISDIFLILGCSLIWNNFHINNVSSFLTYISYSYSMKSVELFYICICFLICSCIKSAQLIGHFWLPDSMEAPVPASALIHSATLVSAGIFLLLRFQYLYIYSDLLNILILIGSLTACYGGLVASVQSDAKKLLAYSTISHCGFIVVCIGFNSFVSTICYLYLHGIYKALTFFSIGSFLKINDSQDIRFMGFAKNNLFNTTCLIISSINLGGLPFTFGFLYKNLFLNILIIKSPIVCIFGLLVIGLLSSVSYVYKLIYYICFDFRKGSLYLTPLYLQNNKLFSLKLYLNYTYSTFFSFITLFFFSIIVYIYIKVYFLNYQYYVCFHSEVILNYYKFLSPLFFIYNYFFSIVYIGYLFMFFFIILYSNRKNFFYIEKLDMIFSVFIFFLLFFIISNLSFKFFTFF